MDLITDLAIPLLTVCAMFVVGLGLSSKDFLRLGRSLPRLVTATLAQVVLLPLVAFAVIALADPPVHRTLGLIVVASCPGGAFSNFFTALARGEAALSVALTSVCTLIAILTLPIMTAIGFHLFLSSGGVVRPPILLIFGQLTALLVVPLGLGMLARRWREDLFRALRPKLQRIILLAILVLIAWIAVDRFSSIAAELVPGAVLASFFLVPSMILGDLWGRLTRVPPEERLAYVVEFGFRNLGLAIVVTVTLLNQPAFLAFATVLFVMATLYALLVVAIFTRVHSRKNLEAAALVRTNA